MPPESAPTISIALGPYAGSFTGQGVWHDEAGESRPYTIEMRLETLPNGEVRQWFKHLFFEENNAVVEQTLTYTPQANGIFTVSFMGAPISGRGYAGPDLCHYTLHIPGNAVEVTHVFKGDGQVRIFGSSEKNSQGHYIWWEEQVRRSV